MTVAFSLWLVGATLAGLFIGAYTQHRKQQAVIEKVIDDNLGETVQEAFNAGAETMLVVLKAKDLIEPSVTMETLTKGTDQ